MSLLQHAITHLWETIGENYDDSHSISDRVHLVKFLKVLYKLNIIE